MMAKGARGKLVYAAHPTQKLYGGDACFYGYTDVTLPLLKRAMARTVHDFYYIDNAYYFGRGDYFRITKNEMIHNGVGETNLKRFENFEIELKPFKRNRNHILITTQSSLFYKYHFRMERKHWVRNLIKVIEKYTDREIKVCWKPEHVGGPNAHHPSFESMLEGAHVLVTHSSSTCIKALIEGVPAIVTGHDYIKPVGTTDISRVEKPPIPRLKDRLNWLGVLADNQFNRGEMKSGYTWRKLNE